ncbi:hypothetical protein B0H19DRAFT_1243846 [Mycena capillaripes]|nr:hypothetical protein B0H19DRAFT_1243846 [Mycena capillaripes]
MRSWCDLPSEAVPLQDLWTCPTPCALIAGQILHVLRLGFLLLSFRPTLGFSPEYVVICGDSPSLTTTSFNDRLQLATLDLETRHAAESDQPIHSISFYLEKNWHASAHVIKKTMTRLWKSTEEKWNKFQASKMTCWYLHRYDIDIPILLGLPLAQTIAACRAVSFLCASLHLPLLLRYPPPSPFLSPSAHGTRDANEWGDATEGGAAAKVVVQAPSSHVPPRICRTLASCAMRGVASAPAE